MTATRKPARTRGIFVTGTDTGVGKTFIAAAIARALVTQGHRVGVYKPVASGAVDDANGTRIAEDAKILHQAAGARHPLADVCPQMFLAPLSPPRAAAAEKKQVDAALLREGLARIEADSDFVIVEGAGGLMSPLAEEEFNADVAYDLGLPLLVVVENRLGAINQALQTLIAASAFQESIDIAGIVLNQPRPGADDDASIGTNAADLKKYCVPPLLADVRHGDQPRFDGIDFLKLGKRFRRAAVGIDD